MKTTTALLTLAIGLAMGAAIAQDLDGPPRPPGGKGHRPPPSPIVTALDLNHDGTIDADEIAKAAASLKTLDKNGDGKLTKDEFRPPRPARGDQGSEQPPPPPPDDSADAPSK